MIDRKNDFETDWFPVTSDSVYTFVRGFAKPPARVVIHFAKSENPTEWYVVSPGYYNDGTDSGYGAQVEVDETHIRVGTGAAVWSPEGFGGPEWSETTGGTAKSGYYKILASL